MTTVTRRISVSELCQREGLTHRLLVELVEHEVALPVAGSSAQDWEFDTAGAHWLRKALRLQRDFDLDAVAVAMLVDLLRERERLFRENRDLQQRLARFLAGGE